MKEKREKVTPWEVEGVINYGKLIKEFGLKPMPKLPEIFNRNILFRRGIIFAHRDFERILDASKKRKKFVMMTGLMPSGKFHFGHLLVAQQILFYQSIGATVYVAVADLEAYNTRIADLQKLRKIAIEEYLINYIALGLQPKNCDFYFQSQRSGNAKKANAYYRLAAMFARHATFNEFKAVYGAIDPAKMSSSLLQAADMYHAQLPEFEAAQLPTVIPVGADQDPHIRIARDIASRIKAFNFNFQPISSTYNKFIPGLKGINTKMSSSDPLSYIALTDTEEQVKQKIDKYAFSGGRDTIKEHREKGGNPDIDISYQWLYYSFEPNDKKLKRIHDDYKSGSMLTSELKAYLIGKINSFLRQHQKKREAARKQLHKFMLRD